MTKGVRVAMLAALAVLQLGRAGWSIARYETVLREGTAFKIRTEPVDPADAFRGRFLELRPSLVLPTPVPDETRELLDRLHMDERKVYAVLEEGEDGFARVARVVGEGEKAGPTLEIAAAWERWRSDESGERVPESLGYFLGFDLDRYFVSERKASAAERRAREAGSEAWIVVRVKDGVGVIEDFRFD